MLNSIIRFSLRHRLLVIAVSVFLLGYGGWQTMRLNIDVFPDLNRPRVVVMTEAPGMAPEEVEALITFPMEVALNGANHVEAVRTQSGPGLSVVYVDFAYGTDIYDDRQVVNERLQLVADRLPKGVTPQLAPISSIMGQILMVGMRTEPGGDTTPLELRTLADWTVRQRLLTIPGVSQVFTMGGDRKQFQVLVDPDALLRYGVTLRQVKRAVIESNGNATGGYLDEQGPNELLVRGLGRIQSIEDLEKVAVALRNRRPVQLSQVARVIEAPQVKRGDSSAFVRREDGSWTGGPAVILTVNKQPDADTRQVTDEVTRALNEIQASLPEDIRIEPSLYSQKGFIDRAVENVMEALRDGGILVVIILFMFLMNFRTTFITLTAIPLSIVTTALVFSGFGLSINTMTLGGLAVAIGELVDDAIVDVENIFRRLRENQHSSNPQAPLLVVFRASAEIRNSIVFSTMIVVLVFIPLFALSGMEGRLFTPLGVAYVVSILASLLVSLTVTPVLSYWLLARGKLVERDRETFVLRSLKWVTERLIRFSLTVPRTVVAVTLLMTALAIGAFLSLERDFLPPFNEGTAQLNVVLPPGTSLQTSGQIARQVEQKLREMEFVDAFSRRTGRAELDEHAMPVNVSEFIVSFGPQSGVTREEALDQIRDEMKGVPGVVTSVEQPLAHLISHMLSGVKAEIGIKLFGDDLDLIRRTAQQMQTAIADVPGVTDLMVEPQQTIPQLRIELDRDQLFTYGLTPVEVNEYVATALNGDVVSQVLEGMRTFDLMVRLDEPYRENLDVLRRLSLELPDGGRAPLSAVAKIYASGGPNVINREDARRRIILQSNVTGRGVVDVVEEIQQKLQPIVASLPPGYFVEYGGQFESERSASRTIAVLFIISLTGVFLVLYTMFRSINLSLQVMAALPMAFIGSVAALLITGQTLTIAAMVGFIALVGIASRNGILLLNHYLHLVQHEGEEWTHGMIVRGGRERLAPVLMTALSSGIALVPLTLAAGEPGKEILYPVATVIVGGLVSSTLLDFLVRPALFWLLGRREGERVVNESRDEIVLEEQNTTRPLPQE